VLGALAAGLASAEDRAAPVFGPVLGASHERLAGARVRFLAPGADLACPETGIGSFASLGAVLQRELAGDLVPAHATSETSTDSEGRFTAPPGARVALVEHEDHAPLVLDLARSTEHGHALDRGSRLTIHVEGHGFPAEAQVHLIPISVCRAALEGFQDALVRIQRTDAEGRAVFDAVARGAYVARVVASGWQVAHSPPLVSRGPVTDYRVHLVPGATIGGSIEPPRAASEPVPLAVWWTTAQGVPAWVGTRVDLSRSEWQLSGLPSDRAIELRAWTPGSPERIARLLESVAPHPLSFAAPPWVAQGAGELAAARFATRVVRAPHDEPVEDLELRRPGQDPSALFAHAPQGRLRFGTPDGSPVALVVSAVGTAGADAVPLAGSLSVLPAAASLEGVTVQADDGTPIEQATVELRPDGGSSEATWSRLTRSEFDGKWSFEGVPEGAYRLEAREPYYGAAACAVSSPGPSSHELLLGHGASVRGSVMGLDVAQSATVRMTPLFETEVGAVEQRVDARGAFAFEGLAPGPYGALVTVLDEEQRTAASQLASPRVLSGRVTRLDFNVGDGILFTGRALLGREVLAGGSLRFHEPLEAVDRLAETDLEGRFAVVLPAARTYSVRASWISRGIDGQSILYVPVSPERSTDEELRFPTGEIKGRAVDEAGHAVPGAATDLYWRTPGDQFPASPGKTGSFERIAEHPATSPGGGIAFSGLPPGQFRVALRAPGFAQREVEATLTEGGRKDLGDITLERARTMEVYVVDPEGKPLPGVYVVSFPDASLGSASAPSAMTDAEGRAELSGLSGSEEQTLVAFGGDWAPAIAEGVHVDEEGPSLTQRLELHRGGGLAVQALAAAGGAPTAGVRVRLVDSSDRDWTTIYESQSQLASHPVHTGADGVLHFRGLRPGRYTLTTQGPWRAEATAVTVVADQATEVLIHVE
jgi:protocatechuate 3,4-dioxygenase beta subunit